MDWQERLAAAEAQKQRTEQLAAQAAKDAQAAQKARSARWHNLVQELSRVRRALIDSDWPGAYRRRDGLFRVQSVAEMPVTVVVFRAEGVDDGYTDMHGQITYYRYPAFDHDPLRKGITAVARVGIVDSLTSERVGSSEFLGNHIHMLTPDMVMDAAARYCIDHGVDLPL